MKKTINIFLASSINEFKNERNEIGDFIRRIQDILIEYDIFLKLIVCEYLDNNISILGRKQEDYNQKIKTCDIFFMLIGQKLGDYTKEEYNVARQNQREIHVAFISSSKEESVTRFIKEIKNKPNIHTYQNINNYELKYTLGKIITEHLKELLPISIDENNIIIEESKIKLH